VDGLNTTHMHVRTHVKPESLGQSGRRRSEYHDAMTDHDRLIDSLLDLLDLLGIAENSTAAATARRPHGIDTGMSHIGLRCAADLPTTADCT
jgi:arylsulfatase